MTQDEIKEHNERMIKLSKEHDADVLETDNGIIVGYGTDADYDTHAVDVQNGTGYYDDNGHFRRYETDND